MVSQQLVTTQTSELNPDFETRAYQRGAQRRKLPRALMGGTAEMKKFPEYLPQHPAEDADHYKVRAARTVLRNFFSRTVDTLVGKVFSQPVVTKDMDPKFKKQIEGNIDLTGRDIHSFAREVFENSVTDGVSYILVDFPRSATDLSLAEERQLGLRPYLVSVKAADVIGWKVENIGYQEVLTEVRIKETVTRSIDEDKQGNTSYGEELVYRVRILRIGSWELWESTQSSVWKKTEEGLLTLSFIGLVPVYTSRTRFFEATPPLEDLAYMNLEHYQIRSDQRNALSVASFPILAASGFQQDADGKKLEFGPNKMLVSSDPNAKFYYVESGGAHLAAGDKELKSLEEQMSTFGLQFEVGNKAASATGRALDHAEGMAPLLAWTLCLEDAFNTALSYMEVFAGLSDGAAGKVEFNKDFGMSLKDQAEVEALLRSRAAGDISRSTFLSELKRRKLLPDDFDVEAEMTKIENEGPPLGNFTQRGKKGAGSPAPIASKAAGTSGNV